MQEQLAITLKPERVAVSADRPTAQVVAVIENQSSIVDNFTLELTGIDPDWYTLPVTNLGLFPGEQKSVNIAFHAPIGANVLAGRYDYIVRVKSSGVAGRGNQAAGALYISLPDVLSIALKRQVIRGQEATFELTVTNRSRTTSPVTLEATDPEGVLEFTFDPPNPPVPAGGSQAVQLQVHLTGDQVPLAERAFRFTITARTADDRERAAPLEGQFIYVPVQVRMELDPQRIKGAEATFNLNVQNPRANTVAITCLLDATDKDRALDFTFKQRRLPLEPGNSAMIQVTVRVKPTRKPEIKAYPFTITVRQEGGDPTAPDIGAPVGGEFLYEPAIAFDLSIERGQMSGQNADYTVKLNNTSHLGMSVSLRSAETQGALVLAFATPVEQIQLPAGTATEVLLLARLKWAPPAQQTTYPFSVIAHAIPEDGSAPRDQTATAEFVAGGQAGPVLRLALLPPQARGEVGRYKVQVTSAVGSPLQVKLGGHDDNAVLDYAFEPAEFQLGPGAVEVSELTVTPRDHALLPSEQPYNFEVISFIAGMSTDDSITRTGVFVPVGPVMAPLAVQLEPGYRTGNSGQFELMLVNQTANPFMARLRASDDADALEFQFQSTNVPLQPREVMRLSVIVQGREGAPLPGPYRYPFTITGFVPGTIGGDESVQYGELVVTEAPAKPPTFFPWQRILIAALLLLWMILPFLLHPLTRGNEQLNAVVQTLYQLLPGMAFPALGAVLYGSNPTQVRGWRAVLVGWISFGGILAYVLPLFLNTIYPPITILGLPLAPFVYLIFLPALVIVLLA